LEQNTKTTIYHLIRYIPSVVFPSLFGFIAVAVYTRLLSPQEYGYFTLAFSTSLILEIVTLNWLNQSILRYYERYCNTDVQRFYSTALFGFLIIGSATAILTVAVLYLCGDINGLRLRSVLLFLPLIYLCQAGCKLMLVFLRAMRKSSRYSLHLSVNAVLKLLGSLIFIYFLNLKAEGILLGLALAGALVFFWEALRLAKQWHPRWRYFNTSILERFARFGIPLLGLAVVNLILSVSDRYLIEILQDSSQVGVYSAGYRIAETGVYGFVLFLNLAAFPVLIKVFENEGERQSKRLMRELMGFYVVLILPIVAGISLLSEEIITVMLGRDYHAAHTLLPWISCGIFFMGLGLYYAKSFELKEKTLAIPIIYAGPALLNIVLNIYLIPPLGIKGAAISTCISYFSCLLLLALTGRKKIRWQFPWMTTLKAGLASFIMGWTILMLPDMTVVWKSLVVKVFLGSIIYLFCIVVMEAKLVLSAASLFKGKLFDAKAAK
jgi:O-antigen/teichoic acid export membrane protein